MGHEFASWSIKRVLINPTLEFSSLQALIPDPTTLDIRGTMHPRGKRSLLDLGSGAIGLRLQGLGYIHGGSRTG